MGVDVSCHLVSDVWVCMGVHHITGSGDVFGVLQIINKADGPFTLADEEVCALITKQAGVCLRNAQVHKAQVMAQRRMRHLTDLVKAIQGGGTQIGNSTAVNNLVFTIQAKAPAIVSADRCVGCSS